MGKDCLSVCQLEIAMQKLRKLLTQAVQRYIKKSNPDPRAIKKAKYLQHLASIVVMLWVLKEYCYRVRKFCFLAEEFALSAAASPPSCLWAASLDLVSDFAVKVSAFFWDTVAKAVFAFILFDIVKIVKSVWRHSFRIYDDSCVIGWSCLMDVGQSSGSGAMRLIMPSEEIFSMRDLLQDDDVLYEAFEDAIDRQCNEGGLPDFMVVLKDPSASKELTRRISNRVSQSIKGSQWPAYAHSLSHYCEEEEGGAQLPLMLLNCEKDSITNISRVWLVFPSELRLLLRFTEEELLRPVSEGGLFHVSEEHHRKRLVNLRKWAMVEFGGQTDGKRISSAGNIHGSREIWLPTIGGSRNCTVAAATATVAAPAAAAVVAAAVSGGGTAAAVGPVATIPTEALHQRKQQQTRVRATTPRSARPGTPRAARRGRFVTTPSN